MGNCFGQPEKPYIISSDYQDEINAKELHPPSLPLPPRPQTPELNGKPNYIALFDYENATLEDLSMKKNDPLFVINQQHEDWWLAKNLRTEQTGFVPRNYISPIDNLETREWFFPNCTRREAERLLEYLDNEPGIFLIREAEQDKNKGWSLSILDQDEKKERHTKHYRIKRTDDGGCYISTKKMFASLEELVDYYSKEANGLCRPLTTACPKVKNFMGFKDVWEESRENITLGEIVGTGNFGEVYKGLWRQKHIVAVKTVKIQTTEQNKPNGNDARYKEFLKELEIMKKLRHEKIVKLWCVCTNGEPIYLVTEYMVNGSLLKYLRGDDGSRLKFKQIIDMAAQIASGMKYLESSKCVHRDLAARNILVGEKNIVKIADFGFAQMLNQNDKIEFSKDDNNKFPVKWTAPEVFSVDPATGKRHYTIKSDVWSFGVVLYEIITKGQNPYPGMNHAQVIHEIKTNNYRMPKPNGMCTEEYYSIMRKCWDADPIQRPTFEALLNYFNDYFIIIQPSYKEPS